MNTLDIIAWLFIVINISIVLFTKKPMDMARSAILIVFTVLLTYLIRT